MSSRIAFSGKMGAGKSSACKIVSNEVNGAIKEYSFARKLKSMAADLFGIDPTSKDKEVRRILQDFGSYMRKIDEDVWVKYLIRQMNSEKTHFGNCVQLIDDLRYQNEFWALRDEGFIIIRLEASPEVRYKRMNHNLTWEDFLEASNHASETDLDSIPSDEWDLILETSGSMVEMHNCIRVKLLGKEPL